VSWNMSRANRAGRMTLRRGARGWSLRNGASLLLVIGLLLVAGGCGMDVQTNRPYTPAEGINFDVGDPATPNEVVHVRNLLIISWQPGEGVLSGSVVTSGRDSLTGVSGAPIKVDGTEGAPFIVTVPSTVALANGLQVVLTDQAPIILKSPDLTAGLEAIVTLQFENAGEMTTRVPIVDGNEGQYRAISPSPTPTPSV
jgi:hypothetical protein